MQQQLLITTDDVITLARGASRNINASKIGAYIREAENIDIKSALGDPLFIDLKENKEKYSELMDGGVYEVDGAKKIFQGLTATIAYYAYAKLMKNGDYNVTSYGVVNKESEYSSRVDYKQKVDAYNDAFRVADMYLKECVNYLNDMQEKYPLYKGKGKIRANRTIYRVIGE